jgi:aminoglycoside phosphotransferase (APT) family kinase protein
VLVYGDFNIHSILAVNGDITGVVDWETSTIGCAEPDLAYIQPHVSQHMKWGIFVDHYSQNGGKEIVMENMPFYLVSQWTQLTTGASQLHAPVYDGDGTQEQVAKRCVRSYWKAVSTLKIGN